MQLNPVDILQQLGTVDEGLEFSTGELAYLRENRLLEVYFLVQGLMDFEQLGILVCHRATGNKPYPVFFNQGSGKGAVALLDEKGFDIFAKIVGEPLLTSRVLVVGDIQHRVLVVKNKTVLFDEGVDLLEG